MCCRRSATGLCFACCRRRLSTGVEGRHDDPSSFDLSHEGATFAAAGAAGTVLQQSGQVRRRLKERAGSFVSTTLPPGAAPNQALQLATNSSFQAKLGSIRKFNAGCSATLSSAVGRG